MSKKTTLLTVVIAAALLLVIVLIAVNAPNRNSEQSSTDTTQSSSSTDETTTNSDQPVAATITYTENGFEPSTLTVKTGDTVRVENKSSSPLSFNSGDHPTHTKDSDLNVGDVPQGGNKTFTVTKAGTFSFHNHDNASDTGTITVQ